MLSIGSISRQTGIEIGTLRKWESRYGFPRPSRRDSGQRLYPESDIARILDVARRIAAGERVGKVIRELGLDSLPTGVGVKNTSPDPSENSINDALNALCQNQPGVLLAILNNALQSRTNLLFVDQIAAPLTIRVGELWVAGRLPIHGEHLFSGMLENLLNRRVLTTPGATQAPAVLLTTPAGEQHTLGLAMVDAVISEFGIGSLRLSANLPAPEIVAAARAYQVQAVGLSVSCNYPPRLLADQIRQLRAALPGEVALWLGGAGCKRLTRVPTGVRTLTTMPDLLAECAYLLKATSEIGNTDCAPQPTGPTAF
jgi:methylmalonyl-CoA mutase cobalamin-binding subunit